MKTEVAFFRQAKRVNSIKTLLALYRSLGMTDEEIRQEMQKFQAQQSAVSTTPHNPDCQCDLCVYDGAYIEHPSEY